MKNVLSASSLNSMNYDDFDGPLGGRRTMAPIRELDFESRIMFNAKLPKKKPFTDQLRKNDFVVDINDYKLHNNYSNNNNNNNNSSHHQQHLMKTFKNCFNQNDDASEAFENSVLIQQNNNNNNHDLDIDLNRVRYSYDDSVKLNPITKSKLSQHDRLLDDNDQDHVAEYIRHANENLNASLCSKRKSNDQNALSLPKNVYFSPNFDYIGDNYLSATLNKPQPSGRHQTNSSSNDRTKRDSINTLLNESRSSRVNSFPLNDDSLVMTTSMVDACDINSDKDYTSANLADTKARLNNNSNTNLNLELKYGKLKPLSVATKPDKSEAETSIDQVLAEANEKQENDTKANKTERNGSNDPDEILLGLFFLRLNTA